MQKNLNYIFVLLLVVTSFNCAFASNKPDINIAIAYIDGNIGWLNNGLVKVAVDRQYGGAIVHASVCKSGVNMVNIYDKGRQIQQSYYAGKSLVRKVDGQSPNWSPWAWNPVQAGNFDGDQSTVLNFEITNKGSVVYTKCQPRLWDMNEEEAKCYFSQWIQFEEGMDNVIRVTNTIECFRDKDDLWGTARTRSQELPAVYAIRNMSQMIIYNGDEPWTNDKLTIVKYGLKDKWIWTKQKPTEPWAACVYPDTNIGFGVYSPAGNGNTWNMGWVGKANGTEYSGPTMHFAPIAQWKLDHNTKRTYHYWIIIGELEEIRNRVYQLHKLSPNVLKVN
jgi:hypothetical protein